VVRQWTVQEGEVRVQQVAHAKVLLDESGEAKLRLLSQRLAENLVKLGIELLIGRGGVDLPQPEPLAEKILHEPHRLFVIQHISNALGQILVDHTIYIDHTSLVVIDHGYRSISLIPRNFPKAVEQVVLQSFDGTLGSAPKTTINPAIKVTQLPKVSLQIFDLGFGGG